MNQRNNPHKQSNRKIGPLAIPGDVEKKNLTRFLDPKDLESLSLSDKASRDRSKQYIVKMNQTEFNFFQKSKRMHRLEQLIELKVDEYTSKYDLLLQKIENGDDEGDASVESMHRREGFKMAFEYIQQLFKNGAVTATTLTTAQDDAIAAKDEYMQYS
tara:strand:- start:313 stop:786 length:474 start_codon:yes stop_codon:yes gene_type:complete